MKKSTLFLLFCLCVSVNSTAQLVATVVLKNPVEGLCDPNNLYSVINGYGGQIESKCPVSLDEVLDRLNTIEFLKANPKFKSKGSISLIINCKAEVVSFEAWNKKKNENLNTQVEEIFRNLGAWTAGIISEKQVDSYRTFYFTVKAGKINWGS